MGLIIGYPVRRILIPEREIFFNALALPFLFLKKIPADIAGGPGPAFSKRGK